MAKMDKSDLKSMIKKSRVLFKGGELPKVHGYEGEVEELVIRQPGEVWTDKDGKEWKQLGINTKTRTETPMDKIRKLARTARSCPKENCTLDTTKYLDKRMNAMKGMCFTCVQEYEQKLKDEGKYESYEKKSVLHNERSFLQDAKEKMVESKQYVSKNPEFLNENGTMEEWSIPNKKKLLEDLESDLADVEERLETIGESLEEYKDMEF
jgi:uncharacterized protein YPO0396